MNENSFNQAIKSFDVLFTYSNPELDYYKHNPELDYEEKEHDWSD